MCFLDFDAERLSHEAVEVLRVAFARCGAKREVGVMPALPPQL